MIGHSITVGSLKKLLEKLSDSDIITTNVVGNLTIERGDKYVGWVDLWSEEVEYCEGCDG
jgi:hypothetical protein